jgi:hypothetical protein
MNKNGALNSIEKVQAYNKTLEQSSEFQRILPEVMNEVYSQYVKEEIERSERYLEREDAEEDDDVFASLNRSQRESTEKKLNEAKRLMPDNPEQAAQVFMQLGSCHTLWALQKRILKEKYGITWYTPAELHPEIIFD